MNLQDYFKPADALAAADGDLAGVSASKLQVSQSLLFGECTINYKQVRKCSPPSCITSVLCRLRCYAAALPLAATAW
jgi:hypothetical protein